MTEPMKQRWEDVGQRFEALGRVLKERYQSAEHAPDTAHAAEQDEASEERAALREAFDKIVEAAQELGERAASIVPRPGCQGADHARGAIAERGPDSVRGPDRRRGGTAAEADQGRPIIRTPRPK